MPKVWHVAGTKGAGVHRGSRGAGPPGGGQGATPPEAEAFSVFSMTNYACF